MANAGEDYREDTGRETALVLKEVRHLAKPRQLQVPSTALRTANTPGDPQPGRGLVLGLLETGGVRFKLYLWLRWYTQHAPDLGRAVSSAGLPQVRRGMRLSHPEWARLLALPDPDTYGARRVSAALAHLERGELIIRGSSRPAPVVPTWQESWPLDRARPVSGYAALPVGFFTGHWAAGLSSRATTALLILIDAANPRINMPNATRGPATYIAESILTGTYGVSEDLYRRGRAELEEAGLVSNRLNKRWARDNGGWSGVESTLDVEKLREQSHPKFTPEE